MMSLDCVAMFLRSLRHDETGAVTVDWVGVTAGILLLGLMVVHSIFNVGVNDLVSDINSSLEIVNTDVGGEEDAETVASGKASLQGCKSSGKLVVCIGPQE